MSTDGVNVGRRRLLIGATAAVGAVGVGFVAVPFVKSWQPSARAKAAGAPVEYDAGLIEAGQQVKVAWRGKPVVLVRRTPEMLAGLAKVETELRDPGSDESDQPTYAKNQSRSLKPELLVMVGICTHLGCLPGFRPEVGAADLGGSSWVGGFFCPCHGSKYDLAGRVYKGVPAPKNMEIPPYSFRGSVVVIGVDKEHSA
jgi:ubiquinol-cytochrome c reductase iron-sulfur subunit